MIGNIKFLLLFLVFISVNMPAVRAAASTQRITVLNEGDAAPANATLLSRQGFTGNDPDKECSYHELLEKAKTLAAGLGANVVKIDKHRQRTRKFFCDEISVAFYKVADISAVEKHFSWSRDRKLTWADFKGPVRAGAFSNAAAETAYGISVETSTVSSTSVPKVYFVNSFETGTSWVKPGHDNRSVLMHEQTHFDICELYTRKMRERVSKVNITLSNLQQVIRDSYQSAFRECSERQRSYDEQTRHGIDDEAQARWTKKIEEELNASEAWTSG